MKSPASSLPADTAPFSSDPIGTNAKMSAKLVGGTSPPWAFVPINGTLRKLETSPEMARQGKEPTPTPQIEVSLGRGTGKVISGGKGSTGILEGTGKPPTSPTEKTVSAGKGLEQIVREKQATKQVQRQKPEFEQKQLSKQEQFLKNQEKSKLEQKTKTEEQLKQKQEQSLIQRTGLRYIKTQEEKQKQGTSLVTIPKPKQTGKERNQELIPGFVPLTTGSTSTRQTQKQKQEQTGITDLLTVTKFPGKPPSPPTGQPTPPPPRPPTTETPPPGKKTPPDLGVLGVGGSGGLLGKVSKGGARREFVGNVPEASIIGTYSRSELSYSQRTIKKSEAEQSKLSTGRFVQRKSNRIL